MDTTTETDNEMMILDRKSMVGFSYGFSFKINRFKFNYSRQFHHFSNPVNSFGITTNISAFLKKIIIAIDGDSSSGKSSLAKVS